MKASESDIGPELMITRSASRGCQPLRRRPRVLAIMKCAAIALALQGASGLVAPRLTVKSSALHAATLEVKASVAQPKLSLQKRSPRAPPAGPKTSRQRYRCMRAAPQPALLQKAASHTSAEDGAATAPRVAKKIP